MFFAALGKLTAWLLGALVSGAIPAAAVLIFYKGDGLVALALANRAATAGVAIYIIGWMIYFIVT